LQFKANAIESKIKLFACFLGGNTKIRHLGDCIFA